MASFIAKQMLGDQVKAVSGAVGGDKDGEEKKEGEEGEGEEDPEIVEARREMEEKRKEKHRKMEAEREEMRQSIRDKYGLKKKEVELPQDPADDPDMAGRLGRKKKTPAELAAEANADSDDELQSSFLPASVSEFTSKVGELPGKVASGVSEATEKCVVQ